MIKDFFLAFLHFANKILDSFFLIFLINDDLLFICFWTIFTVKRLRCFPFCSLFVSSFSKIVNWSTHNFILSLLFFHLHNFFLLLSFFSHLPSFNNFILPQLLKPFFFFFLIFSELLIFLLLGRLLPIIKLF